ncbi:MAG: DUF2141 domain-containing protein [Spirochaetes bacterium]|nr:DUF2141 domain-containing protein [Spirochaetota bacterium]
MKVTLLVGLLTLAQIVAFASPPNSTPAETEPSASGVYVQLLCPEQGTLRVDLVDQANFGSPERTFLRQEIHLSNEDLSQPIHVRFTDISPGWYALRAFIDRNEDGRLNPGLFGPSEPWALSWKASPKRGIPQFQDIAFLYTDGITTIRMELKE